ncbi:MotA/TolQ/ExbB proton channel family protein [Spartinivicinus poritis]|uniref:MotA/TolQ/ExbB proton channel family protein n=1 Tax=Spartinivicinus poritis TaxID=2994640 RepID=A0ABT5UAN7_9GAMM|nr:MotA/TolQ/ExbB proton channel family protein [Spartinivicinus sp. A2-2]MDE1462612.1 MotA/TolQ/ExbB proton channel family protein [Spartinivicinus sp. A2-2]
MKELIVAGGWLMLPILICSILALAIIIERAWTLRPSKIAPKHTLALVWKWIKNKQLDSKRLKELKGSSPLGQILAAGLSNSKHGREIMKEGIEEAASGVVHDLERFLNSLGTIAAITPLLGLLGTVIGMIKVFAEIQISGTGNADALAGGISEALITTAAGLTIAIPALIMHRFYVRRVDELVIAMEQEATKLVEVLHGEREVDYSEVSK